ncbi:MAG: ABC transporter permease, partial [Pseudomonadota bacterium]
MSDFWRRFCMNRSAVLGLIIFVLVVVMMVTAPLFFPYDPFRMIGRPMLPPSAEFPFGTDELGRNVAAGIAHGASTTLFISFLATGFSVLFGTVIGGVAGYSNKIVDDILMRFTEIFQTIPPFLLAILLVAVLSPSIESVIVAIAVVTWPPVARLVRAEFMTLRRREFVEASITLGMSNTRIIFLQILPNCLSPIIVMGSLMVATAILVESGLSFLGLGDQNVMSWGFLIGAGRGVLRTAWWVCTFPGIAILLTVLSINLIGEGLNDALN